MAFALLLVYVVCAFGHAVCVHANEITCVCSVCVCERERAFGDVGTRARLCVRACVYGF